MRSWPMLVRRRLVCFGWFLVDSVTHNLQDFEAARVKALKVGAKKFFLEVGLPIDE